MSGGGGSGSSTTTPEIPAELKQLYLTSANRLLAAQAALPLVGPSQWYSDATSGANGTAGKSGDGSDGTTREDNGIGLQDQNPATTKAMPIHTNVGSGSYSDVQPGGFQSSGPGVSVGSPGGGPTLPPGTAPPAGGSASGNKSSPPAGGGSGGSSWIPAGGPGVLDGGPYGFAAPMPKQVAGASPLMDLAAGQVSGLLNNPDEYNMALSSILGAQAGAGATPTGFALPASSGGGNPYVAGGGNPNVTVGGQPPTTLTPHPGSSEAPVTAMGQGTSVGGAAGGSGSTLNTPGTIWDAAKQAFNATTTPMVRQQDALSGLSRSTTPGTQLANAWSQNMVLPIFNKQIDLQNEAINRDVATKLQSAQLLQGLGAQKQGDMKTALDTIMGYGEVGRDIANESNQAAYDDYLRRQNLASTLLLAPFGQAQNMIGSSTQSNSSGK